MIPQRSPSAAVHRPPVHAGAARDARWRRAALLGALGALCTVAGCVTINIYFPAAAVEKAADRIIDEVYQLRRDATPAAKPAEPPATK
jgi:hypothetical protein